MVTVRQGSRKKVDRAKEAAPARRKKAGPAPSSRRTARARLLDAILENTDSQLAYLDQEFNIVEVNSAYEQGFGHPRAQLLGRNYFDLFPSREHRRIFERVRATGKPLRFRERPFRFIDQPQRKVTYWDWSLVPVKNRQGKVDGLVLSLTETTAQVRARQLLEQQRLQLDRLVQLSSAVLAATSTQGLLDRVVQAARELTAARVSFAGLGCMQGRFQIRASSQAAGIALCATSKASAECPATVCLQALQDVESLRLNGEQLKRHVLWGLVQAQRVRLSGLLVARLVDGRGAPCGLILVGEKEHGEFTSEDEAILRQLATLTSLAWRHIDARTEAQARAAEAEEGRQILEALMEHIPEGITIADAPDGRIRLHSRYGQQLTGQPWEAMANVPASQHAECWGLYQADGTALARSEALPLARAIHRGEVCKNEELLLRQPDGTEIPVLFNAGPIRDSAGHIVGGVLAWRDISEIKQAEHVLKEADRRKDEFLAMLAHELRNPLTPIINATQIMRRAEGDPQLMQRAQQIIEQQVWHMVRLIDDLLDVSRITLGKIKLRRERVDLALVAASAVEANRTLIKEERLQLELRLPPEPIYVNADPVRLGQVLSNLLNNAAKYTDPGGSIKLIAERESTQAVVSVQDTGIGIAPQVLPQIFDLFTQAEGSRERSRSGLGIGLALAKSLVTLHGGTIEAFSEGVGHGSEFIVRLPLNEEPRPAMAPVQHAPASSPIADKSTAPLRVLVVDDNKDTASSLSMVLGLMGHQVQVAHNGPDALQLAGEWVPEVGVLDIGLPGMNGYEIARRLRATKPLSLMLLIAVTGWGREEDRREALAAGFDYHMTKPADPSLLEQLLTAYRSGRVTS